MVVQDGVRNGKVMSMFSKLAGSDGAIDSEELQDMLTAYFSKGELLLEHEYNYVL